ncbi:uncharacterized protein METZ01_LOCUS190646 [marine metagenome]|uniref:Uncharacterized protein n=1 Tax=marine metagenome TaxID=408172 RepID=A0A382DI95_9ZZZZ
MRRVFRNEWLSCPALPKKVSPVFYEIPVACEQTSGSPLSEFTHQTTCGSIFDRR